MVPHGCDGAATSGLRVRLPDGVSAGQAMAKPGWTIESITGPYAVPVDVHGTLTTDGVREIVWSGSILDPDQFDEFVFRGQIDPALEPGTELIFDVTQTCGSATETWTPALTVTAAGAAIADHAGHADHAAVTAGPWTVGDLRIDAPFARATLPNAPVGGGFLTITNEGRTDDTLVAARSAAAGHVEVHEMAMDGDVMRMRELADGLPIPAGETVMLTPGGFHLMFMDLQGPLVEGETVDVTLTFEQAGEVTVPLSVGASNASEALDHAAMENDTAAPASAPESEVTR